MNENKIIEVGERLRKVRESLKMSQNEFSASLEVTQANISKYENGKTLLPAVLAGRAEELQYYKEYKT